MAAVNAAMTFLRLLEGGVISLRGGNGPNDAIFFSLCFSFVPEISNSEFREFVCQGRLFVGEETRDVC